MSAEVLPFSSAQAAELAEDQSRKRESTARARAAILNCGVLQRHEGEDGVVTYALRLRWFENLTQLEDFLDEAQGEAE